MSARHEPCERVVVGLDGGYVRSRHRRPEYNFEVVAGKVLDQEGSGACFAFVRDGGSAGENAAALTLRRSGLNESTSVTVLPDGALGEYALAEIERAKWRFWNGYAERGIIGLVYLAHWTAAQRFDHLPSLKKLSKSLLDVIRYLESNSDSMPDQGERYRAGTRISTGFAKSAVNEIIAKRMAKKQQLRWNRYTVQRVLDIRVHELNGTLEDAFRLWHRGFRLISTLREQAAAA